MADSSRESILTRSWILDVGEDVCNVDTSVIQGSRARLFVPVSTTVLRDAGVELTELAMFGMLAEFDPDGGNLLIKDVTAVDGYIANPSDRSYWAEAS